MRRLVTVLRHIKKKWLSQNDCIFQAIEVLFIRLAAYRSYDRVDSTAYYIWNRKFHCSIRCNIVDVNSVWDKTV